MAGEVMNFQAFPADGRRGMGFREYAAAAALQGILASTPPGVAPDAPQKAVEMADALIRELQRGQTGAFDVYGE